MKKRVIVVDGMGGGVGASLIESLRARLGENMEIVALGTNSIATERMLKAGAARGASGENAIRVTAKSGSVIIGPIGIVIPDGMLGEITATMARAILEAPGKRILIPVPQDHFTIAGLDQKPLGRLIDEAVALAMETISMVE